MRITALKLRDEDYGNQWAGEVEDRWDYADFLGDGRWREGWISFDCLCHEPATDTVYAGVTSFDADIFHGWNRRERAWVDPGYARVRDPYDAKFHRALVRHSGDGCLYASQALLHDVDRFWEAPGASIVRYDPATNEIAKLGIPMPHVYIQAIELDEVRGTIYGQTFTPENLVAFDLDSRTSRWLGPTSSGATMAQGENICLDDAGRVWGVWTVTRAWQSSSGVDTYRFFRYDPNVDRIEYLDKGLPREDGAYGYARPEGLFNLGTGGLYMSGEGGALYRVDPESGDAEFLFRPIGDEGRGRRSRLAALALGPDGCAYGVTGRDGECEILKFNPANETFELMGALNDSDTGVAAWQVHHVCVTPDGTLYAGENDNPHRSSYLWEIEL